MLLLRETQNSLSEIASNQEHSFGVHFGDEPRSGVPGMVIGEVAYDPTKHAPSDIAMFSLMEMVTETPHVLQMIPVQPLEVNVVTQHEAGRDDPRVAVVKQQVANSIRAAVIESMPGITDRVRSYHIGDVGDAELDRSTEVLAGSADSLVTARTVADICRSGLTFVVSDFNRLPLDAVKPAWYPSTIAVKTNHPSEIALPANSGIIRIGGRSEVNTGKPKELQRFNQALTDYHQGITDRLGRAGIAVAQVVYKPQSGSLPGFDNVATDRALAQAISQISRR